MYGFGTIRHQARKQGKPKLAPFFFLNSIVVEILIVAEAAAARRCWAVGVDIRLRARLRAICIESIPVSAMSAWVTGPHFPTNRTMAVERSSERRRCAATATMRASLALLIINPSPSCEAAKSTMLLLPHLRRRFRWLAVRRREPVTHLR